MVALIGPNGAGKTTLFNVISRLLPPTSGQLLFEGADVTHTSPQRLARMGIGRTFQDVRLFDTMTAWDNIAVFAQTEASGTLRSGLLSPRAVGREAKRVRARVDETLDYAGLSPVAATVAGELSFAQQKKVAIARCLAQQARLMLLDEPASGLDAVEREDVAKIIEKLSSDGVTILLVEHNMDIVREVAHRAIFLAEGKIVGEDAPDRLLASSELAEIYFGHLRAETSTT
ncbi:MAG: ATP-binding cassette domain-containing protein [Solirubrobacterales bacterium]|nr:ATP-binding cassette domain-containing protein [Solirubrobacterales bacterium]MBV9810372.1 ATP-binding cassette domain-containing protein [Solirubrobacterales bacterium]